MIRLPGPSLTRRLVLALLAAFLLVWVVLVGKNFLLLGDDSRMQQELEPAARALLASLAGVGPEDAGSILAASERQFNYLRRQIPMAYPGDLVLALDQADGTPVYRSAAARVPDWPATPPGPARLQLGDRPYWALMLTDARWRLWVLEPVVADRQILRLINSDLLPELLLAFPLVLLPLWLAVRGGLGPLRQLAREVAARTQDDFSPLATPPRHAELRPLVVAFNRLFRRARRSLARERALVQDAAHELRTPLAAVAAQAHVLAQADQPGARQQALSALEGAVDRASHLVGQLLTLARLEEATHRPPQSVDLVALTRDILIAASPAAAARGADLALESPDRLTARLDAGAFHSVLENLLANAIAHGPPEVRVVVTLEATAGRIRLGVADNGPGIPREDLARLFQRFQRGTSTATRGSGLGLAIVRQAVRRLGGELHVDTGLDARGIAFRVSFHQAPGQVDPASG